MSGLFELRNASKHYLRGKQKVAVFDRLSIHIDENTFLVVMGPSGSGKTTLLNLLAGFEQVTDGQILFRGEEIQDFSEKRFARWRSKHIGFVFQFYNLIPTITAFRNVEVPLMLTRLGAKARRQRVEMALEVAGLRGRSDHRPSELSGGEQQRVAIARSIVADADVLLCDEPTGDLDRQSSEEIVNVLRLMNDELGKSIVMVTHDEKLKSAAKRVLYCDKGEFTDVEPA